MHTLYDSENYSVTHMLANAVLEEVVPCAVSNDGRPNVNFVFRVPVLMRDGFEIVDKHTNKEVYLDGSWADLFRQHIYAWEQKTPTQDEVEETISQYAELAQNPVLVH